VRTRNWAVDRDHFKPDVTGFEIVKVKMEAGDLLIFNSPEPHGIRPNTSGDKVRMAQYISMMPAEEENEELRQWRITSWKERNAPEGYAFPGDPRKWEQTKYETAELSPLVEGFWAWINGKEECIENALFLIKIKFPHTELFMAILTIRKIKNSKRQNSKGKRTLLVWGFFYILRFELSY